MTEGPLYVQFPAEAAIPAQPHHETFHLPFFPRSAHARHLIALGLASAGSMALLAGVLYPLITRSAVALPVFVPPAQIVQPMPLALKGNRLEAKRHFDGSRFAQVAEKLSTGETRIFTYHRLTLVFNGDSEQRDAPVASSFTEENEADTPIATPAVATFADSIYPRSANFASQRRSRFPIRGVPLNVSVATAGTTQPHREFQRLVSMPKSRQDLTDILKTAGIAEDRREQLVQALATDTVVPGDSLELLMEKGRAEGSPKLVLAKLRSENGSERVVASDDSNGFKPLADDRLFSTLYSEGQPDAPSSSEVAAVDLKDLGSGDQKDVRERLTKAGLSDTAIERLVKLAAAKGIPLAGTTGTPDSVDLLFRKADDSDSELMFIEFHSGDEAHRFYLHKDGTDSSEYYDDKGHSVAKVLNPKPVPNGQLGDGFAWRIHPILGVRKFHNGVDFRAPMGSPIMAAGDGTVELISTEVGYGKYIRIRHDGGYETTYAHISATPSGLKVGQRVKQGQVIAYVGSTGYSTGPHLYYELRVNGRYENPLTAKLPAGTNLTGASLDSLRSQVDHVDSIMSYLDVPTPEVSRSSLPMDRPFGLFQDHAGHIHR
ncbi:M23 family metallopeptidase [Rhizobium rhododendri]|uniref:M23 family metallopeptidase n=1 Tax=Rhizobium rhododendri TaxID=2506430 RepID=A0ABY8IS53_9HYPH|nr:M23 family metallopeptidase [Rhizobium rhododendri]WFS26563.1 M23 family metallopeptidase [Rhizobium rhododendri]